MCEGQFLEQAPGRKCVLTMELCLQDCIQKGQARTHFDDPLCVEPIGSSPRHGRHVYRGPLSEHTLSPCPPSVY